MRTRTFALRLTAAVAVLAPLCLLAVYVVGPHQTVAPDLGLVYGSLETCQQVSLAGAGVFWLVGAAVTLGVGVSVGLAGWWQEVVVPAHRGSAAWGRACVAAGVLGLVAASTAVLGFPVGLGYYSQAQRMGVAPAAASMSRFEAVLSSSGVVLLVVATVIALGLAAATAARRRRRC